MQYDAEEAAENGTLSIFSQEEDISSLKGSKHFEYDRQTTNLQEKTQFQTRGSKPPEKIQSLKPWFWCPGETIITCIVECCAGTFEATVRTATTARGSVVPEDEPR